MLGAIWLLSPPHDHDFLYGALTMFGVCNTLQVLRYALTSKRTWRLK